jgi:predicted nuclease of restriction endonuclease-like RecB superfamily
MKRKGFRSEFERGFAHWLIKNNIKYDYEKFFIEYQPKVKKYTPDFYLSKQDIYIETKGFFDLADRQKHLLIREQNPDIDIRFLFVNANNKLNKSSKTTYGQWCDKHKILWAEKRIPNEWLI